MFDIMKNISELPKELRDKIYTYYITLKQLDYSELHHQIRTYHYMKSYYNYMNQFTSIFRYGIMRNLNQNIVDNSTYIYETSYDTFYNNETVDLSDEYVENITY